MQPILFIVTDEETGYFLNKDIENFMTNLNGWKIFYENGLIFKNHRTASVACPPSRACLYAGRYPKPNTCDKIYHPVTNVNGVATSFFPDIKGPTMPNYFSKLGYDCHYIGKFHQINFPTKERLEEIGWKSWNGPEPHGFLEEESGTVNDQVYLDESLKIIENTNNNLFLAVNLVNPHDINNYLKKKIEKTLPIFPQHIQNLNVESDLDNIDLPYGPLKEWALKCKDEIIASKDIIDQYYDKSEYRRYYFHLLEMVDNQVSTIINKFKTKYPNGIIVRTSDHGSLLAISKDEVIGKWFTTHDLALKVPLAIYAPQLKKGFYHNLSSSIDVLPTLLDLVNDNISMYDGPGINLLKKKRKIFYFVTYDNITKGEHQNRIFERTLNIEQTQNYKSIKFEKLEMELSSSYRKITLTLDKNEIYKKITFFSSKL